MRPPDMSTLILFVAWMLKLTPPERLVRTQKIRTSVGSISQLRKKMKKWLAKGFSGILVKVALASMYVHLIGNPDAMEELTGIDESWCQRYSSDRTLKNVLPAHNIPFLLSWYDTDLELNFDGPLESVATIAGLCTVAPKLGNLMFPDRYRKSETMSLQSGMLILWHLRTSSASPSDSEGQLQRPDSFRTQEAIDWANGLIIETELESVLDLITTANLQDFLDESDKFGWPFFWATELCPSEYLPDAFAMPAVGLFDEFHQW